MLDAHEITNTLNIVYGCLHQIRKRAKAQGADMNFIEIRDLASEGLSKIEAIERSLALEVIKDRDYADEVV
jgi:hypothetical protein